MFRKTVRIGLTALALGALATSAGAQQPPAQQAPAPIVVRQIVPNVYWAQGGAGSNNGIIVGTTGVIVVDVKTTPDSAKLLLAEIAKITPKPVTHVILTHSDGDHVNGIAAFPAGITVIAHQGNKNEQDKALAAGGRGAPPADKLPNHVVTKNMEALTINGVKFELYHWVPAHTSGDLVIYLPDQKVGFTGDLTATNRPDPYIHPEKDGNTLGWITTAKGILTINADTFMPGHGELQTKAFIETRMKNSADKRTKVEQLVKEGKTLAEIKTALNDPAPPPAGTFVDVAYDEVTKK